MKKTIFFLSIFLPMIVLAQVPQKKFLDDVLGARAIPTGDLRIYQGIHPSTLNEWLDRFTHSKGRTFSSIENPKVSIKLTEMEVLTINRDIRKEYETKWTNADFSTCKVLENDNVAGYLSDRTHTFIELSHPVFIRNNEIAVLFFSRVTLDNKPGNVRYDLSIYHKENGIWRKWIVLYSYTRQGK